MENLKLRIQFEEKLLEYYAKAGDQELLDNFAMCYYQKDWRVAAVQTIAFRSLQGLDNEEEYIKEHITNQIKVLDELINEK